MARSSGRKRFTVVLLLMFGVISVFLIYDHGAGFQTQAAKDSRIETSRLHNTTNLLVESAYSRELELLDQRAVETSLKPMSSKPKLGVEKPTRTTEEPAGLRTTATATVSGRVIDLNGSRLRGITVKATTSTGNVLTSITTSFGTYRFENIATPESLIIRPTSKRYRFSARILTVTGDEQNIDFIHEGEPVVFAAAGPDQIVPLPNPVPLNGSVGGGIAPLTAVWSKVSGPGEVAFANPANAATMANITVQGTYVLRLSVTDAAALTDSDDVQIVIGPAEMPPPPDPVTVAPPIVPTTVTNISRATEFLYTGPNPIQTGVNPDDIERVRVSLLRGRVMTKANVPIPNVNISVLNRQEFGQTRTRADGEFDLVVNGGGEFTIKYDKPGFIPVQREISSDWQKFDKVEDVVMIPYDPNVTAIDLASSVPIQVASGGLITDNAGARRSRLFFRTGTTAFAELSNGTSQSLVNLSVRSTEFTVGNNGLETMPGTLPSTSEFTYASEYSVDEAVALGATNVRFSQPVVQYLENFINMPVGAPVPTGSFNRKTGNWEPERSGRVVKILSVANGIANLDVNGNGIGATDAEYLELGINIPERQKLTEFYPTNQTLWRVPLDHFSPWDCNYPPASKPPPDAPPPFVPKPKKICTEEDGCYEEIQSQTVKETIEIVQTGHRISYQTSLQRDFKQDQALIPLVGPSPDPDMVGAGAQMFVAGRVISSAQFSPSPGLTTTLTWDGRDDFGRVVQGSQTVGIAVAHFYPRSYAIGNEFGQTGNGSGQSVAGSGLSATYRSYEIQLGGFDQGRTGLGGWSFDVHHAYNPTTKTLIEGTGKQRSAEDLVQSVTTTAGRGQDEAGFSGDDGPAVAAQLNTPSDVAFAADGSYFIADTLNNRVRRVSPEGVISTFAGNGTECDPMSPCGDGGAATAAQLFEPRGVVVAPDGSVYISDSGSNRIRRVAQNGEISTIAGTGAACDPLQPCGDGGSPAQAQFNRPGKIHLAEDGSVYIADTGSNRIRKISTNGSIRTIAGNGQEQCPSDNVPATTACIESPTGVALASNGSLFITANAPAHSQTVRLDTDGRTYQIADGICNGASPSGLRSICNPIGVTIGPDGNPYVASAGEHRIYKYDVDGEWKDLVGSGSNGPNGEGQPALAANLSAPSSAVFAPNGDLYIASTEHHQIRRSASPLPGYSEGVSLIASEDGTEVFQFNSEGQHQRTLNALTGTAKYAFAYDGEGRLITITDGDNNVTTVERDGAGKPTGIRSPYGQLTTLTTDANGYLASVTNPAGETNAYSYSEGGLLLTKRDPRNNVNTFTYDDTGRLLKNQNSSGGQHNYSRKGNASDFTVTHRSPMNRPSTFRVQNSPTGEETQNIRFENNSLYQVSTAVDGSVFETEPEGTTSQITLGPDPRWAMQSPLAVSARTATPAGRGVNLTQTRSVSLSDQANPLSLTELRDVFSLNSRDYRLDYTSSNRTLEFRSPMNRSSTYLIDPLERLTRFQIAGMNAANYTYDSRGRLSTFGSGTGGDERTFTNTYNSAGFISQLTDPFNRVTAYQYDAVGRTTQITLSDSRQIGFGYDAAGNLTSVTPPGRPAHAFTYNSRNLLSSYVAPNPGGSTPTTFDYNPDSELTRITRPDGLQINYAYNTRGQLQSSTTPSGTYSNEYDAQTGQLTAVTAPGGVTNSFEYDGFLVKRSELAGPIPGQISYAYNDSFALSSVSINGAQAIDYTYDNDRLLIGAGGLVLNRNEQNGLLTGTSLGNVSDTISYNGFGEQISYDARFNSASIYSEQNTYDKLGRITRKIEAVEGVTRTFDYGYDTSNRLATVSLNGGPQPLVTYSYDSNNNRTSVNLGSVVTTATYDTQDRLISYGAAAYEYTANGELQSKTNPGGTTNYNYDVLGNLRSVTLPGGTQIEYVIDGFDRRIGKRVNGALTQGFLYQDQLQVAAELDSSGGVVSRFVYASRSNSPDFMIKNSQVYRMVHDHLGSVRLVVNVSSGTVAQRIDYDEFGVILQDTNPGFQPFGFAGGLYDTQTGLVRFGARDYDPETGRWTTKEIPTFFGFDTNLYSYAFADPINFADINGRNAVIVAGGVVVVFVVVTVATGVVVGYQAVDCECGVEKGRRAGRIMGGLLGGAAGTLVDATGPGAIAGAAAGDPLGGLGGAWGGALAQLVNGAKNGLRNQSEGIKGPFPRCSLGRLAK